MQKVAQTKLSIVFWLVALTDIGCIVAGWSTMHYIAKALLVPVLLMLISTATAVDGKRLLQIGLFFSWMGDVLLLFESRDKLFFIFGLVCFLTTHVLYIIFFLSIRSNSRSFLLKQPWWLVLVPAYGVALAWQLYPKLGDLKIPVIVYAIVICTMLLCSLHAFLKVRSPARHFYWLGATAFVLSDSLLAINKFYQPFAYAGVFIMFTYCAAQFFIVKGYLEQEVSAPLSPVATHSIDIPEK